MCEEWKPIEKAPVDTPVLIYEPRFNPPIGVAEYLGAAFPGDTYISWNFVFDKESIFKLWPLYWKHLPEIPNIELEYGYDKT